MQKPLLYFCAILAATQCLSEPFRPLTDGERLGAVPTTLEPESPPQCTCVVSRLVRRLIEARSTQHHDMSISPEPGQPSPPPSTPQGNTTSDHVFRAIITALTLFNINITWRVHGKHSIIPPKAMPRSFDG